MDISIPLKPAAFHILLALSSGESYGYAMMQSVREQSGGRVPLQTGSFYRHLGKLIDGGLIAEAPGPASADSRRGTYYRLNTKGKRVLKAEQERLADLLALAANVRTAARKADV